MVGRTGVRPVVFDTSVYIPYLRGEAYTALIERAVQAGRVRLSAVVLGELYAGTRSPQDKADLDVVTRAYQSLGFLVTPSVHDWVRAGQGIRRYRNLYGSVQPREHLNDILILLVGCRSRCGGRHREREAIRPLGRAPAAHGAEGHRAAGQPRGLPRLTRWS